MSEPFFINDFKQNPDCYLDKEPAIVKELPEENRIVYNYYFEDDMVWCLTMDKIFYYIEEDGTIYSAKISEKGQKRLIRCYGSDPEKCTIDFKPEELTEE